MSEGFISLALLSWRPGLVLLPKGGRAGVHDKLLMPQNLYHSVSSCVYKGNSMPGEFFLW